MHTVTFTLAKASRLASRLETMVSYSRDRAIASLIPSRTSSFNQDTVDRFRSEINAAIADLSLATRLSELRHRILAAVDSKHFETGGGLQEVKLLFLRKEEQVYRALVQAYTNVETVLYPDLSTYQPAGDMPNGVLVGKLNSTDLQHVSGTILPDNERLQYELEDDLAERSHTITIELGIDQDLADLLGVPVPVQAEVQVPAPDAEQGQPTMDADSTELPAEPSLPTEDSQQDSQPAADPATVAETENIGSVSK